MNDTLETGAQRFTVLEAQAGQRLDRVLEDLLPGSGLRQRRRLIEGGRVLLGGRPAPAGLRLRAGQTLELLPEARPEQAAPMPVVARTKGYAALDKPAGLHSAALAGGGGESVEALLPGLFPEATPRLLNRLDFLTSGLLLVALDTKAAEAYAARKPGAVLKEYLALVQGDLAEPLVLKRKLDTDDRRRTRVLGRLEQDAPAWTLAWPVARLEAGGAPRTLLLVRIQAGARHQIRAHLAAADLPIVGDPLYGDGAGERLFLHHARLALPGFSARSAPPWRNELAGLELLPGPEIQPAGWLPALWEDLA